MPAAATAPPHAHFVRAVLRPQGFRRLVAIRMIAQVGDGLFQVGADIQRGRYHTNGASRNCYWAKLKSSNTSDIIDNNNSTGPQTVVIDSPYFTSDGCDEWVKVG